MAYAQQQPQQDVVPEFEERVVHINRCSKVVKGGRRFGFAALVVVGNGKGKVGYGTGKAKEVSDAIRKATEAARKNLVEVHLKGKTLHHTVQVKCNATRILMHPAAPGRPRHGRHLRRRRARGPRTGRRARRPHEDLRLDRPHLRGARDPRRPHLPAFPRTVRRPPRPRLGEQQWPS